MDGTKIVIEPSEYLLLEQLITMSRREYPDLEPDEKYAQLLIEGEMSSSNLLRVQCLIRDWGIEVLEVRPLPEGWTLIRLKSSDMRKVAFKLSQQGFFNLKGVNPVVRPVGRGQANPEEKKRTRKGGQM
ncbi:MAG: hypothetical protein AB1641_17210 [Thermodesulfobacteriota bacterium]